MQPSSARRARRSSAAAWLLAACLLGVGMLDLGILGVGAAHAAPTEPASRSTGLRVGGPPPALDTFRIAGADGVSLPALRGRVVVLDFWATWCGPCRMIMPALDALHARFHDRGLTVLGVAREPEGDIRAHLARSPVGYTIARDLGHTMTDYDVRAIPTLVVIDRRGNVREIVTGVGSEEMARVDALVAELIRESGSAP